MEAKANGKMQLGKKVGREKRQMEKGRKKSR